jgi:hypothetical protein
VKGVLHLLRPKSFCEAAILLREAASLIMEAEFTVRRPNHLVWRGEAEIFWRGRFFLV